MGKAHCICKEEPCRCFNGWGTYFKTPGQLLGAIGNEIRMSQQRESWLTEDWSAPVDGYCAEDEDEIIELWDDGYNANEIALVTGFSLAEIRYLIKEERARRKREGRSTFRTGGLE